MNEVNEMNVVNEMIEVIKMNQINRWIDEINDMYKSFEMQKKCIKTSWKDLVMDQQTDLSTNWPNSC